MNAFLGREALAEFCVLLTQAIVHFAWQGCVVALLYFAFDAARPRMAAKYKYLGGVAALLLMAACLPITMAIHATTAPAAVSLTPVVAADANAIASLHPNVEQPQLAPRRAESDSMIPALLPNPKAVAVSALPAAAPGVLATIAPYATMLYLCGTALMLLRVSVGFLGGRRLRKTAMLCDDPAVSRIIAEQARRLRMRVAPPVAWCARVSTPVVVGVLHPIILLPPSLAAGLTNNQLGAILLHELAHIRRYDLAINLLQRVVEAVLFFHPAVWWVSRRVSCEREIACDDLATAGDCSKLQYAEALVRAAELSESSHENILPQVALAAAGRNQSQFKHRVQRLLGIDEQPRMRTSTLALFLSATAIALLLVAPAVWRSVAKAENEPKSPPTNAEKAKETDGKASPAEKPKPEVPTRPKTTPLSLSGRALDADGKPIKGAKIYLASQAADYKRLAETTTDGEGRYEFHDVALPLEHPHDGPSYGEFEVFGQAEGYGLTWRTRKSFYLGKKPIIDMPGRDESELYEFDSRDDIVLDLKFLPAASLGGRLVDDHGQPIPNATLAIRYSSSIPAGGYGPGREFKTMSPSDELLSLNEPSIVPREIKVRKTDANGKFEFTGLPPNYRFRMDVRPPDFALRSIFAATQDRVDNTDGEEVFTNGMEIVFKRPVRVPIQVLYADTGKPAPKVFVSSGNTDAMAMGTTDADGKATLKIPPGEHHLELLPEYGTPYLVTKFADKVTIDENSPNSTLTLKLRPAAVVEITVLDADTGKALENVDYWVADPATPRSKIQHFSRSWQVARNLVRVDRVRTDANGVMRILFEPGSYQIGVGSEYLPRGYKPIEPEGARADCEAGKTLEFLFQLRNMNPPDPAGGARSIPKAEGNSVERAVAQTPVQPDVVRATGGQASQEEKAKSGEAAATPVQQVAKIGESAAAGEDNQVAIRGRVVRPDRSPLAGAKVYAVSRSNQSASPRLKDPKQPLFEIEDRVGKAPLLKFVHPQMVELLEKLKIEPTVAQDDPRLQNPEVTKRLESLYLELYELDPAKQLSVRAISDADGRFQFTIPKADLKQPFEEDVSVIAVADGFAPAWNLSHAPGSLADVELRMADDVPIHGRIVNSQGKPVPNAKVMMGAVLASPAGTVDFWVDTVMSLAWNDTNDLLNKVLNEYQFFGQRLQLFPQEFVTDAEGKFTITGVGAGRAVFGLKVSGVGIANDSFSVMVKPGKGIDLSVFRDPHPVRNEFRTYGAEFEHVVPDSRSVSGTVRDLATGLPVEGVQIAAWVPEYTDAFTDANGKYELVALAPADRYEITAWPWGGRSPAPFVATTKKVRGDAGDGPIVADFNLVRGVILRGKLTDKQTGQPLGKARISYGAFKGNPHLATFYYPGNPLFNDPRDVFHRPIDGTQPWNSERMDQTHTETQADGSFDIIVLPGKGVLLVNLPDSDRNSPTSAEMFQDAKRLQDTVPSLPTGRAVDGIKLIEVAEGDKEMEIDFPVDPPRKLVPPVSGE